MNKMKKTWLFICVLTGGLLLAGQAAWSASAAKQLQKGIDAYEKNDPDKALDYFIDVLMNGDNEQVRVANRYIDAIHSNIGGIKNPVEVNMNFPDQPTQTIVDPAENLRNYGQAKLDTLADESEQLAQEAAQRVGDAPKTLTEQIEARQLANYTQPAEQVVNQAATQANQTATKAANTLSTAQDDLNAIAAELNQKAIPTQLALPQAEPITTSSLSAPTVLEDSSAVPLPVITTLSTPNASSASTFADLTSDAAIAARNLYTTQKLQSMKDSALASLQADPRVHVYLREDGRLDALDIDEGTIFKGNAFYPQSLSTLNNIYELLALNQGARYIILPAGSYTDDVTLSGIRQAMALKSYLVKRGISQGKLYYNMGLVDQEVPAQFSNLKGLSIVFDYDTALPTRLLENEGDEKAPLLSMAIVPPCRAIDPSLGEAYAIDFSVLETVDSLDNWMLQIIQHGRDGNYYIVRQLEGFSPLYHQILWNGRKGILGPELPCGKYTVVLSAVDTKGQKQTLRRRLIVKCGADAIAACQAGSCNQDQQETVQSGKLDYQAPRLWVKPGRTMYAVSNVQAEARADAQTNVQTQSAQQAVATSTSSNSYTVTKTTRNIVTDDRTPASSVTSSSEEYAPLPDNAGGYAPAAANPYDMPYEEEYATY